MEELIGFPAGPGNLEGMLEKGSATAGVVISHPHPLYGGTMENKVVISMAKAYRKMGYTTLRFNFRGVGNSTGHHEDGIGEQQDVRAAVSYLAKIGIQEIDLTGYSFGAWVNALSVTNGLQVSNLIMISPPLAFIDFNAVSKLSSLRLIVTGSRDDIAPPELIRKSHAAWNADANFEVINGADHFYTGYLDSLEAILTARLSGRDTTAIG